MLNNDECLEGSNYGTLKQFNKIELLSLIINIFAGINFEKRLNGRNNWYLH